MSTAQWKMLLSPPSTERMQIRGTNTTSLDLNIDIEIPKWLWLEVIELEISIMLRVRNLEALEGIWINHCCGLVDFLPCLKENGTESSALPS
jgi:hypothetical protein